MIRNHSRHGSRFPITLGGGGATDPYWPYVSMLLHGDSPQQFNQDASTNVFPITAVGAVQASTRTPFTGGPSSYGSGYFGGSGNYLSLTANAAFTIPVSTSFTIEAWIYLSNVGANQTICANPGYASGYSFRYNAGSGLGFRSDATLLDINQGSTTGWVANTWYHVAVVRNGASAITIYRNGVSIATGTSVASFGTGELDVGGSVADGVYLTGYISNFRLVNGTAVYTSAFTPPTTQLTAVTNTALLTLQTNVPQNNNQFFDTSTNNFTVTRNGNTTQGSFNPFVPTYPYAVATNGGSAYFDGTGDYLSLAANAAFTIPVSTSFTIEAFIYITDLSYANGNIICANQQASSGYIFLYNPTLGLRFYAGSGAVDINQGSVTGWTANTWYHVAAVRNGASAITLYRNGVSVATGSYTSSFGTGTFYVGGSPSDSAYMNGYISNFRLVNGTAVYTTTFTPPTAPLTAVTNTALLLGMSNGAIYDNAELNNLETVANAQISTSVFKYGTGALKFNGTTDYLVTSPANQAAFAFGSGDFTIECWVYISSYAAGGSFYSVMGAGTSTNTLMNLSVRVNSAGTAIGAFTTDGLNFTINPNGTTGGVALNTWTHIAVVRNGTSFRTYTNGVSGTNVVSAATLYTTTQPLIVGALGYDLTTLFSGYIDDLRVTKGIARYTTTFTPPTAAFPNK